MEITICISTWDDHMNGYIICIKCLFQFSRSFASKMNLSNDIFKRIFFKVFKIVKIEKKLSRKCCTYDHELYIKDNNIYVGVGGENPMSKREDSRLTRYRFLLCFVEFS